MKSLYQFCRFTLVASIISYGLVDNLALAQTDDAQQALQQLRLLQQRLSQNSGQQDAGQTSQGQNGHAAKTQSNGQKAATANASNNNNSTIPAAVPALPTTQNNTNVDTTGVTETDAEIIERKSFQEMTQNVFPLNPEQILRLKQAYQNNEYAVTSPVGTPPKPTATSQFVNLSPGSTPPVIRLSQGFVSSLVFLDSSGAPWPIAAYDLGDPTAFNIQWDKTSNTLMIQAQKLYNYGNLAVRLKGLNTPVMLTLIPGQKAVDYRVDLRVQGYGPNAASLPMEEGIPPPASDVLLHILDGVPPAGSQRLVVNGGDARAWLSNEKMYVRTNLTVLSPGWLASMTSADGTHAYEMQKSPVLLVSWHGKVMQLKVEGL
jgi:intracellular multiplication protein IcmK